MATFDPSLSSLCQLKSCEQNSYEGECEGSKALPDALSVKAQSLRKKYQDETDKRLHAKRVQEQNQAPKSNVKIELGDPFAETKIVREPIEDLSTEVIIIGGGFGGQQVAVHLLKAGIKDFRIIEKGSDFGGAWYWNQYPGAQCDIESYVYMPLLEETGYMPTQKFVYGPELLDHARRIGRHHNLYGRALLQTEATSLSWDNELAQWITRTSRGDTLKSRFVVSAPGPLHRPKLPFFPGLDQFKGRLFHTSRWDYSYTGGMPHSTSPQLDKLADKRVGIIGTGATAVQIVPQLGKWTRKLYVFQRTPSSVDVRANPDTDPAWAASLKPGWQRERMDNFNEILCGLRPSVDLVSDGWTKGFGVWELNEQKAGGKDERSIAERKELLEFEDMEQIRQRVDRTVKDSHTAESLKPYYHKRCKRPCWHDDYLQSFNQDNVVLVDTHGNSVERATEQGIIANGVEYELDCLVLATGFEVVTPWWQRSGIEVVGRNKVFLRDKWADGPRTRYGFTTNGFPNCFFLQNAQSGLSAHFLHVLGHQAKLLSQLIQKCRCDGIIAIEPTQEMEDDWVERVVESRKVRKEHRKHCTPGYYNNDGVQSLYLDKSGPFGGTSLEYMRILDAWWAKNPFEGFHVRHIDVISDASDQERAV